MTDTVGVVRVAWFVAVTAAASLAAAVVVGVTNAPGLAAAAGSASLQYIAIVPLPFLAAGIFLLWRRPGDRVAWLLVGSTAGTMAYAALLEQIIRARLPETGIEPWMSWALIVEALVMTVGLACLALLIGLFPDGVPRARRERWFARAVWFLPLPMVLAVLTSPAVPIDPVTYGDVASFPNPLFIEALGWLGPATTPLRSALAAVVVVALGLLLLRYRESEAEARRKIRWTLYGSGVALGVGVVPFVVGPLLSPTSPAHGGATLLGALVLPLIPLSIVVAVEQPRWIDTDAVIRSSFAYGAMSVGIVVVYGAVAAGLGLAAGARLPIEVAIVVTAGLAVAFQPARIRLQRVADRWVFGGTATPIEAVADFDQTMQAADADTPLGPTLAELVRTAARLRWAAVDLPPDGEHVAGNRTGAPVLTVPIRREGETFGWIRCGPKVVGRFTGRDADLVTALASHAALQVANVRLAGRIVHAQEAERRRIERNIHDGAQQELVALVAKLSLARTRAGNGGLDDDALRELQTDARTILRELRELAQGIHPSVLTDGGLVEAVQDRCSRLPIDVTVDASTDVRRHRFPDDIEGAAYFFVTEALTNVMRHATATHAQVTLRYADGHLDLTVADDGDGFDPATVRHNGLAGLSDRLAALAGTLRVDARPSAGTVLRARLPVGEERR